MKQPENTIITSLIEHLNENGGTASAISVCTDVMGLSNCTDEMARSLVKTGLPRDKRIHIDTEGKVTFRKEKEKESIGTLPLNKVEFVVVDIEATSLPHPRNRITEFAAVLVHDNEIVGDYSTLVNPGVKIPKYVREMTGISNEMVSQAPPFTDLTEDIMAVVGDRVIVAHNSQFDVRILNFEFDKALNLELDNSSLCTVKLTKKLVPGLERYRLGDVANYFDIEIENRHRALDDAAATAKIFLQLLERCEDTGINYLEDLLKLGSTARQQK